MNYSQSNNVDSGFCLFTVIYVLLTVTLTRDAILQAFTVTSVVSPMGEHQRRTNMAAGSDNVR
jgi:hypothetical protein